METKIGTCLVSHVHVVYCCAIPEYWIACWALPWENKISFVGKVCYGMCNTLQAKLQGTCKTRLARSVICIVFTAITEVW